MEAAWESYRQCMGLVCSVHLTFSVDATAQIRSGHITPAVVIMLPRLSLPGAVFKLQMEARGPLCLSSKLCRYEPGAAHSHASCRGEELA